MRYVVIIIVAIVAAVVIVAMLINGGRPEKHRRTRNRRIWSECLTSLLRHSEPIRLMN